MHIKGSIAMLALPQHPNIPTSPGVTVMQAAGNATAWRDLQSFSFRDDFRATVWGN